MRPCDSSYDRMTGSNVTALLTALQAAHKVETPCTGSVWVDGEEIEPDAWQRLVMTWDGTADGLEDLGFEAAADAMRDASE